MLGGKKKGIARLYPPTNKQNQLKTKYILQGGYRKTTLLIYIFFNFLLYNAFNTDVVRSLRNFNILILSAACHLHKGSRFRAYYYPTYWFLLNVGRSPNVVSRLRNGQKKSRTQCDSSLIIIP